MLLMMLMMMMMMMHDHGSKKECEKGRDLTSLATHEVITSRVKGVLLLLLLLSGTGGRKQRRRRRNKIRTGRGGFMIVVADNIIRMMIITRVWRIRISLVDAAKERQEEDDKRCFVLFLL
mmetsp:Transcript_22428/g.25966  ORF Transcript_22428/g.25966 Transcript_22428/m.25966 type:complete len:120 (+) Transcript_22428:2-361(+)